MDRNQGLMEYAQSLVYKQTATAELHAHLFYPEGHLDSDCRPAIAFFSAGVGTMCDQPIRSPLLALSRTRGRLDHL